MLTLVLGCLAFVLYFLYDINSVVWHARVLHFGFAAGTALLAAATLLEGLNVFRAGAFGGAVDGVLALLGLFSLAALGYCLFFALPFEETYRRQSVLREAYTGGVYALCRHPGVLCLWGVYLFWGLAALPAAGFLRRGLLFSLLNTVYALFQDRVTFPQTFGNYASYRAQTPFLIPTARSIRRARETLRAPSDREVG